MPLTAEKAAELSAFAMDNARIRMYNQLKTGAVTGDVEAQQVFKQYFREALTELTGGKTTSSVSYGNCSGNIPQQDCKYDIGHLGLCTSLW